MSAQVPLEGTAIHPTRTRVRSAVRGSPRSEELLRLL
jgi:hypothetical protein